MKSFGSTLRNHWRTIVRRKPHLVDQISMPAFSSRDEFIDITGDSLQALFHSAIQFFDCRSHSNVHDLIQLWVDLREVFRQRTTGTEQVIGLHHKISQLPI